MRKYILGQLRSLSTLPGKQKTWVSQLKDEHLYELFLRLRNGETSRSIASVAQKKWEVNSDSSIHSTAQGISKFKKRISLLLLSEPEETLPSQSEAQEPTSPSQSPINDLEELEQVASRQYRRINQMMDEEQETGLKNLHLNRDIQALTALNKAITKRREWEMVHSGHNPVRQQKLQHQRDQLQKKFGDWLSTTDDEGRDRMLKASQHLMEMLEKNTITLERGPDGEYKIPREHK